MTYEEFTTDILRLTSIDLSLYKEKQMKRRINTLMVRKRIEGYEDYLVLLHSNEAELRFFLDYITINVTEFFRIQEQWNYVADEVIPTLPDDAVIWSSACSSGEEAYSLAISIAMRRPFGNIRIIATDIDDKVLEMARKGEYTERVMDNVYSENIDKYFTKTDKGYRVIDEIRSHIEFQHFNLLADIFPQNCDMIVCRNVLIYFTDEAKQQLYRGFTDSLVSGGYLFTGNTEQILNYKTFGFSKVKNFLYKKS